MPQQVIIPKTPEEVAVCLSQLTETEQCVVKGVIIGLNEARRNVLTSKQAESNSA